MMEELTPNMQGISKMLAKTIYSTNMESKKLSEEQGNLFHHLVAKLLNINQHIRQEIQRLHSYILEYKFRHSRLQDIHKSNAINKVYNKINYNHRA